MKASFRIVLTGLLTTVFVFVSIVYVTNETTAIAEQFPSSTQNISGVFATSTITPTIFLPIIHKLLPQSHGLLFVSDRAEAEKYDIYSMSLDGNSVRRLTTFNIESNIGFAHRFLPRWSPDGTKIAVQVEGALYLLSSDGSILEVLLNEPMMAVDGVPAWSPDGEEIAYIAKNCNVARPLCNDFTGGGVRVINVQTKVIKQVISDGIFIDPFVDMEWMLDGQSLLAVPHEGGGTADGIIIGYLDGSSAEWILTDYVIEDFEISPNGQKIVFDALFSLRAYIADIDGSNIETIFDGVLDTAYVYHATWHPSGNQIAYAVARNSGYDRTIYVANADGSNAHDILPSAHSLSLHLWGWTPDGSKIIFDSDRNRDWRHYDIYTANGDGSNLTNLTPNSPQDDKASDYRP